MAASVRPTVDVHLVAAVLAIAGNTSPRGPAPWAAPVKFDLDHPPPAVDELHRRGAHGAPLDHCAALGVCHRVCCLGLFRWLVGVWAPAGVPSAPYGVSEVGGFPAGLSVANLGGVGVGLAAELDASDDVVAAAAGAVVVPLAVDEPAGDASSIARTISATLLDSRRTGRVIRRTGWRLTSASGQRPAEAAAPTSWLVRRQTRSQL